MSSRRTERIVERAIEVCALTSVAAIALVFVFVAREAADALFDGPLLRSLLRRSGPDGSFAWQPIEPGASFDVAPLFVGSVKITLGAMLVASPVAVAAALAASEILRARARRWVVPLVEMLAGAPSVVIGLVASSLVAPSFQALLGTTYAANALVASVALSVAVAPIVFAVTLEGFLSVPRDLREASYALGARRVDTALRVVLPAAAPSVVAALTLGFGRAIGETMIVLMTSGNAAVTDASPFSGARTVTATIAAELGESARGSTHWRVLFVLGLALVTFTLVLDTVGHAVARAMMRRRLASTATTTAPRRAAAEAL